MTSLSSLLLVCITTLLVTLFHLLVFSPVSSFYQPPNCSRGLSSEIKTRLGSIPPSCHNKCNQCHPCVAVQVPTIPGKEHVHVQVEVQPGPKDSLEASPNLDKKYSNYKPLGWKCRCNDQFYNP